MKPQDIENSIRSALETLPADALKPWAQLGNSKYIYTTVDPNAKPYEAPVVIRFDYLEVTKYMMACNPLNMTILLDSIEVLRQTLADHSRYNATRTDKLLAAAARIAELEAELAELRKATTWQTIETAPKDKTKFVAATDDGRVMIFTGERLAVAMNSGTPEHLQFPATHWMPLPKE